MFRFSEYQLKKYNFWMIIIIAILCVVGFLILTSAMANDADRDSTLKKQLLGFAVGAIAMVIISLIDYHFIIRIAPVIYLVMLVLLGALLIPGVGVTAKSATRWLSIGGIIQIQPSEFAKIGIIVCLASFFAAKGGKLSTPQYLGMAILLYVIPALMILKEPDLSTTLVTAFIFVGMIYVAKISYKWVIGVLAVAVPTAGILLYLIMQEGQTILKEYQLNRILSWLYPDQYSSTGLTTQQDKSVLAISSGQLYCKGLNTTSFESVKNGNFLSEENCDFIFAVIGEELGFVGSVLIITLMAFLVIACIRTAARARDMEGRLLCVGMACLIAFQTFVNIGVATRLLPNTGLPLPFISAGVSSLLSIFMGMGLVLNVGLQRKESWN